MASDLFSDLIKKFFNTEKTAGGKRILVREKLVRSAAFCESHNEWMRSGQGPTLLYTLNHSYQHALHGSVSNNLISLYSSREANGFAFGHLDGAGTAVYEYLMDHFKDRLLDTGYRLYTSDRQLGEKGDSVIQIDRHYLKPPPVFSDDLIYDQLYGNILIELTVKNSNSHMLKIMASVYSGRQYTEPRPFAELVDIVFGFS